MKKLFGLLFIALILVVPTAIAADKEPVNIYLFHGADCPHCHELLEWFDSQKGEIKDKYKLVKYEIWNDEKNAELLTLTAEHLGLDPDDLGVPFMLIGEKQFSGFDPEEDPKTITETIESEYEKDVNERTNIVKDVITDSGWKHDEDKTIANLIIGIATIIIVVGFIFVIKKAREE